MAQTSDLDKPLPKAPQPDNPNPPPSCDTGSFGGHPRRYTRAVWARMVFGAKRKKQRKQC